MTDKILTLEEVKKRNLSHWIHFHGDYDYQTEDGYVHLIRNGVDLLKDKKAIFCHSYPNGDYEYRTEGSPHYHLIREGVDLLKDKKAILCHSYSNGDYKYKTEDGEWHEVKYEVSKWKLN